MSEERLQEIKDSIEFQYTLAKAKGYDNALLFTNEEEELVEEIDRLNNMIERLNNQLQQKENIIKEVREYINNHQLVFEMSSKKQIAYWLICFIKNF